MPTILHRLVEWSQTAPAAPAQRYKANGEWRTITAREYRDRVYHLALYLESRGHGAKDTGAIFSYNCPEWVHVDLATMLVGAKSTGIYPNSTAKDIQYILNHTESTLLSVQNKEYFLRLVANGGEIPERVKTILVLDGDVSISPKAVAYETALAEGRKIAAEKRDSTEIHRLLNQVEPSNGAFLIYTSGTTGNPKGAVLSHDNLVFTSDCVGRFWKLPSGSGSMFSFLPLCHIAEKLQSIGVAISRHYTVSYCTKFENVSAELVEVQPTLLLCVPRLWEKMMEGVQGKLRRAEGPKKKLAEWAFKAGQRIAIAKVKGTDPTLLDQAQYRLADKLVLKKVKYAMGLGNAEFLGSGAAALPAHVSQWFSSIGLEILEDFGQTESTGVVCMTEPGVESSGTVGKPVPGMEFKLAEDGEIMTRGRHVFLGYHNDPEATAAALSGGWLHTGDIAVINEKGLVCIRGRKKDVLKTSGGKMVAPLPIEEKLKEDERISQVCMVGDGRKYLVALVTLSELGMQEFKAGGEKEKGAVVDDPELIARIKSRFDQVNSELANFEKIKRFAVLNHEFSIDAGEMTPTLKMKRNIIEKNYTSIIDQLFAGD